MTHERRYARRNTSDRLLPLVYDELRKQAAQKMAREPAGPTLQPTALVHEAWLRLVGAENSSWENKAHFFSVAAEALRRVLIDRAPRKQAVKHGRGCQRVDLEAIDAPCPIG